MAKGLGRGLDVFFGEDTENLEDVANAKKVAKSLKANGKEENILENVFELNITEVEPMLNQPRKVFDEEKLKELAQSIKENGIIQPLIVVKNRNGYTIVAGERRWRAAKMAGLKSVPAIVKDYTKESKKKQVALIENISREDLNVVEIARAVKELMDMEGYTFIEIGKITGKSPSTLNNMVRLLKLEDPILDALMQNLIVEGHARALIACEDSEKRMKILQKTIEKHLTVRDVEKLVYGAEDYTNSRSNRQPKTVYYQKVENKLKDYFGYKVHLQTSKSHQKLVIEYDTEEGLDSILAKLKIKM